MVVAHAVDRPGLFGGVDEHCRTGCDCEHHVVGLLQKSTLFVLLAEEKRTELADQRRLAVGRQHEGGLVEEVLPVKEGTVLGATLGRTLPDPSRKEEKLTVGGTVRPPEESGHALVREDAETALFGTVIVIVLEIVEPFEGLFAVELSLGALRLDGGPDLAGAVVAAADDELEAAVDGDALDKLVVLVKHFDMILFLNVPNEDALVHAGRDQEAGVRGPAEVEHVLSVPHQAGLGGPTHDPLGAVNRETVLPLLPDSNAPVIGARGEQGAVGRVADDVGVFVGIAEAV